MSSSLNPLRQMVCRICTSTRHFCGRSTAQLLTFAKYTPLAFAWITLAAVIHPCSTTMRDSSFTVLHARLPTHGIPKNGYQPPRPSAPELWAYTHISALITLLYGPYAGPGADPVRLAEVTGKGPYVVPVDLGACDRECLCKVIVPEIATHWSRFRTPATSHSPTSLLAGRPLPT
jgi:hypothetical protein